MGKRHFFTGLLFVCACTVALLLAEATLRWSAPDGYFVWPPRYSATFAPTMPGLTGESRFVINDDEVRGRPFSDDDRYRVLAVGGSTTECLYLDEAEAWPHLLEETLTAESQWSPVWVGNVGKSGHNSEHHVLQVEKLLDQYPRIDLVVVLVGTNDMTKVGQNGRYIPINDIERQLAFAVHPGGWNVAETDLPFYKRTEIWRTLRKVRDNLAASAEGKLVQDTLGSVYVKMRENRRNAVRYLDDFPDLGEALSVYKANLNQIVDTAEKHRTRVIFATQPSLWTDSMTTEAEDLLWMGRVGQYGEDVPAEYYTPRAMAGAMNAYNAALLEVCRERSLACIDLWRRCRRLRTPSMTTYTSPKPARRSWQTRCPTICSIAR